MKHSVSYVSFKFSSMLYMEGYPMYAPRKNVISDIRNIHGDDCFIVFCLNHYYVVPSDVYLSLK